ncbi:MAG: hypothetical protein Q7K26_05560 [bacterium]|nr:hypothetical protein [bacterium]
MADEKTPTKTGGNNGSAVEQMTFLFFGFIILAAVVVALLNYIENLGLGTIGSIWEKILDYFLERIWPIWKLVAVFVSTLALVGIVHNARKLREINIEENKIYNPSSTTSMSDNNKTTELKNKKWEKVMKYANSDNASDWRLAIIEADVILEELLHSAGYVGESIGEMLKSVDKNEFLTIDDAWEAHKVRNAIAHSGADFQLSERETRRVIALFEKVFKEFQVI